MTSLCLLNALGQRATAKQSGDVFADFGGSTYYRYVYNARGEVVEAVDYQGEDPASTGSPQLAGRRFGYAYDPIGNRQSATRALGTSVSDTFTANAVNQYTSRENDVAYVAGTAAAASNVAVTGGTATSGVGRAGRYWGAQVTLNNTSGPAKANLTVTATLTSPSVTRTESRTAFLPTALQSFSYDDDGNLTGDGVWSYAYDAENRLITMTTTVAAVNAGYPNRQLEFKYDYASRRVQKRSVNFTAGTDVYTRHLYDGNNLVAELAASSSSLSSPLTLLRSFTWGLDLAGSLTTTGGVGALVQISDHSSATSYFPTYDGNGNVASLLRASDGAAAAKYEYSPFGELLRCEGGYAKANPFRFSTKFTDDESGLVYYGARFYSPSLGRFINRDPIAEQGGLNLYGFCGNDGVNHTDYLGQSWLSKLFKKTNRALHKVFRALTPFRAIRSMDRRLERWENNHYQELKIAAAIVASIFTYGAVSGLVSSALNATTMTVAASGAVTVTATGSGLMAASLAAASGTIGGIVGGAAAGLVSGTIMTGTVKGALQGAAAGAILGGVQGFYGTSFPIDRIPVTAVAGGVSSEIQGGSFKQGFTISGSIAATTWSALWMRRVMIEQSKVDVRNAEGASVGFNGDGFKLGGGRLDPRFGVSDPRQISPLGGRQGGRGSITLPFVGRIEYAPGSLADRVVEAYAGPHDWLNAGWSYATRNIGDWIMAGDYTPRLAAFGQHLGQLASPMAGVMTWLDVPLSSPIVGASVIGINPVSQTALFHPKE